MDELTSYVIYFLNLPKGILSDISRVSEKASSVLNTHFVKLSLLRSQCMKMKQLAWWERGEESLLKNNTLGPGWALRQSLSIGGPPRHFKLTA
ncbi:hypothetical protein TNCV_140661 [Trichonephila clavipes]|nr:hypothetical protein TNCV_140661 [Trichonephila clavipes]